MARVGDLLVGHRLVGIGTAIFIYQLETHPRCGAAAGDVLDLIALGRVAAVTSVVTLAEMLVKPIQAGRPDLVGTDQYLIPRYPNLNVAAITIATARRAAALRAIYALQLPDAVRVAACWGAGATAFRTNDRRLRRVRELTVVTFDEFE